MSGLVASTNHTKVETSFLHSELRSKHLDTPMQTPAANPLGLCLATAVAAITAVIERAVMRSRHPIPVPPPSRLRRPTCSRCDRQALPSC